MGDKLYSTVLNSDYLEVHEVAVGRAFSINATKDGEALVYGTDYTYPADPGVLTILSDKAITISGTTTSDHITIAENITANVTLNSVNINVSGHSDTSAFCIPTNSGCNITLVGDNFLKSGSGCAGLQKGGSTNKLLITGAGTLTAEGGEYAAGIGGCDNFDDTNCSSGNIYIKDTTVTAVGNGKGAGIGGGGSVNFEQGGDCDNIRIENSVVTATSGSGAGIGSGGGGNPFEGGPRNANCSSITIINSVVTATSTEGAGIGGGYASYCGDVVIDGGSVKATGDPNAIGSAVLVYKYDEEYGDFYYIDSGNTATIKNSGGARVYLLEKSGTSVTIDSVDYTPIDGTVYAYLPEGEHTVTVDGGTTNYNYVANAQNKLVTVGTDLTITADKGSLVYGKDYTYPADTGVLTILSDKAVTISGSTETDIIFVAKDVSANITLDGVNIDVSSISETAAFKIEDDSEGNVTITLADGSENTLKSGSNCAGLQKNGDYISADKGKLIITGNTGTLTATGGDNGAGIGGGSENSSGSNITITGGTVTAIGGSRGAGIGGGYNASGSNIIISGGSVTAQSSGNGAGIGGGYEGSAENIIISGGTVTATGGDMGAGIGGNNRSGSNIIISGGTVIANGGNGGAGIGGGTGGSGSDITISGGSVTAKSNGGGAGIGGGESGKGSNITISGGTVTATGGWDAAGIGSGNGVYEYNVSGSNITISGGTVTANGGDRGAGIGGGNDASGSNIR